MPRHVLAVLLLLIWPAWAQEVVFPPGSAVGLAPPAGMKPADGFTGFGDSAAGASLVIAELPPEAYAGLNALGDEAFQQRQGITVTSRRAVTLAGAPQAVLLAGTQQARGVTYRKHVLIAGTPALTAVVTVQVPDASRSYAAPAVEEALGTVAFRPAPTLDEKLAALPFALPERAGFRVSRVLAGNSVVLADGPLDVVRDAEQPMMVVVRAALPNMSVDGRGAVALGRFSDARLRDPAFLRTESYTAKGVAWHIIEATGTDAGTGRQHYALQVLRIVPGGYMRALGIARAEQREMVTKRFKQIAGAMEPR